MHLRCCIPLLAFKKWSFESEMLSMMKIIFICLRFCSAFYTFFKFEKQTTVAIRAPSFNVVYGILSLCLFRWYPLSGPLNQVKRSICACTVPCHWVWMFCPSPAWLCSDKTTCMHALPHAMKKLVRLLVRRSIVKINPGLYEEWLGSSYEVGA